MADALTDSNLVISERILTLLDAAKASLTYDGITVQDVWYGDQGILPRTPSLCVIPGFARFELHAAQAMTENLIDTYFMLYHSPVSEQQQSLKRTVGLGNEVKTWLHRNHLQLYAANGDRLTVHNHIIELDPGFAYKESTLHHAVRMTWRSVTKTRLLA